MCCHARHVSTRAACTTRDAWVEGGTRSTYLRELERVGICEGSRIALGACQTCSMTVSAVDDLESRLQEHLKSSHTIQFELGGGGMSRTFVAEERALNRRVVIKVLNPGLAATVSVERFQREIMVVAKLNHPNIVPVLTASEIDALPYFIMPYIEGESLRSRIARGPLSLRETVVILKDVARALAYAHSAGIVHRDI